MITLDTRLVRTEAVVSAEVGDEVVMLVVERNSYYDADAIGADIWRRLDQPMRVRDVCDALLVEYLVDRQTCEADVIAFVIDAHREGLLRIVPEDLTAE